MRVWKYPIVIDDTALVEMPQGGKILSLQMQGGTPTVWVLVDEKQPTVLRRFAVVDTGHPADHVVGSPFVGTVEVAQGPYGLVFHVFDMGETPMPRNHYPLSERT